MAEEIETLCTVKVSLEETNNKIWRQIVLPFNCALSDLHLIIQIAMGWDTTHLYQFQVKDQLYLDLSIMDMAAEGSLDTNETTLEELGLRPGDSFEYVYDFGDYWSHTVEIVEVRQALPFEPDFGCRAGAGCCPPEDCGGPGGFEQLLEAKKDPAHPQRKELESFIDLEDYDPEEFDIGLVNEQFQLELLMEEEEVALLLEEKDETSENKSNGESSRSTPSRLAHSLAFATKNQMMGDEPPEIRATLERLVEEGIPIDDAFAMVISEVGAEMFESVNSEEGFNKERLIASLNQLPNEE